MGRKRNEFHLGFQWRSIIWILTSLIIFGVILYRIEIEFQPINEDVSIIHSIKEYQGHMVGIMLVTITLSILWWYLATEESFMQLRRIFDQSTILLAVIQIVILTVVVCILNPIHYGLVDDYDNPYPLRYGYCFLFGFCTNMFLFPPSNVRLVILGGNVKRVCVAIVMGIIGCIILFT